ncbi:MAG: signal peptidase II [Pirellulales bacterium]|nr:signal peptidase II [Pirellulales bacterium]
MHSPRNLPVSRHFVFWTLAALGLAADLGSKYWMFSRPDLLAGGTRWVWTNHAGFQLSLNEGALFGMGQGNVWLFAVCSLAAAIAIPTWLFIYGGARDAALTVVLGCILGGVLGNLYDRVGLPGLVWSDFRADREGPVYAVRDFILLARRWPPQNRWDVWPNFNVADSLLVCGAIALVLLSLRKPQVEAVDAASAVGVGRSPTS